MWARTVEVLLALWLGASPLIFARPAGDGAGIDVGAAVFIACVALASHARYHRHLHLLNALPALGLIAAGYAQSVGPDVGAAQNRLFVGLVLAMIVVVPDDASDPPPGWRPHQARESRRPGP